VQHFFELTWLSVEIERSYKHPQQPKGNAIMSISNLDQQLQQIALEHLFVATLETQSSDSLDFYDVSVWAIKSALQAAFEAGRNASSTNSTPNNPQS
jgi:hypothetical protein